MDSEEETYDDSGNESSDVDFPMESEANNPRDRQTEVDEYPFEVLSTEEIVQHMVDSIKEVNTVVEVSFISVPYKRIRMCVLLRAPLVISMRLESYQTLTENKEFHFSLFLVFI